MSRFEFLRNIPVGQYLPLDSAIHRLDPRARIVGFILLLGAVAFTPSLPGLALGIGFLLLGLALARIPLSYAARGLLASLPFLLVLAVLQFFFNPYPDQPPYFAQIGGNQLSLADLWLATRLLARFTALVLGLSFASFCVSTTELTRGLEALLQPISSARWRYGLPTRDFVMVIQLTLRFLPFLALSAERIAKAQAARGAEWGAGDGGPIRRARQVLPLIVPLFLHSLRRAENLALAMDARAYGSGKQHTSMVEMKFNWLDGLALGITGLVATLVLLL